jgi:peptidoglycan/LPS O-acetylase OafA/YrhL
MTDAPPSYPPTIASLTSLRFFAAIWVVALHYSGWAAGWGTLPIIAQGSLAVDFFFVLSGFILAHAHIRQVVTGRRCCCAAADSARARRPRGWYRSA